MQKFSFIDIYKIEKVKYIKFIKEILYLYVNFCLCKKYFEFRV